jgi:uncharacterized protein
MKASHTTFISKGTKCAGTLYSPESANLFPVIILCHGLATERTFGLQGYIDHFVNLGFAVFSFDYRCFGDSEGSPRNYISAARHGEDISAAINHVKTLNGVDAKKISLWGSSYGGGHVLVAAANHPEIKSVIAQVPFVSGVATVMSFSMAYQLTGFYHGMLDVVKSFLGMKPHYVHVIAKPNQFALMNTPESFDGYSALMPSGSKWENKAPAKICLTLLMYLPTLSVHKINCPTLYVYAKNDSLIPYKAVEKAIAKTQHSESMLLDCGHFDMYSGPLFEDVIKKQEAFLLKNAH